MLNHEKYWTKNVANISDIVGDYTIAKWNESIQHAHIYLDEGRHAEIKLHIIDHIDVTLGMQSPGMYEDMLQHIDNKNELYSMAIIDGDGPNAIAIKINGKNALGYYLPEYDTFFFGNLTWHPDYYNVILKNAWTQITEKLSL